MKICPDSFQSELVEALNRVGLLWHESPDRPTIQENVLQAWDEFLLDWLSDETLPLIIRTSKKCPGGEIIHCSGRCFIASDNSPASWAFTLAERGDTPTTDQLKHWLRIDTLPFAIAIKAEHKAHTKYFCNLKKLRDNPNERGWKVAHIVPVGMNTKISPCDRSLADLEVHFINLMSPRNIYAVPSQWKGLAEIDPINAVFQIGAGAGLSKLHEAARNRAHRK